MASPFAQVADVQDRLPSVTFDEVTTRQVGAFLRDASALVRRLVPTVDSDLASGDLDNDVVVLVVTQVVMRRMSASGIGVVSEQHPEYQYELSPDAARGLALTDEELSWLRPRSGGRAFSIVPR